MTFFWKCPQHWFASFTYSREGALNLLRDFEGVSEWIRSNSYVLPEHVEILATHEVLRTCEGVGKILLRKPFEVISMTDQAQYPTAQVQHQQQNTNGKLFISFFAPKYFFIQFFLHRTGNWDYVTTGDVCSESTEMARVACTLTR